MLKLSLKPGEYIDIGENIRVVFSGGSANNIHLLVDAPREYNIVRSNSMKQKDKKEYCYGVEYDCHYFILCFRTSNSVHMLLPLL